MRVDEEIDYHGWTAEAMRSDLNRRLRSGSWQGKRRIRVIHGTGDVLGAMLRQWCQANRIAWGADGSNPGSLILHPNRSAALEQSHTPIFRSRLPVSRKPNSKPASPDPKDIQLFEAELRRLGPETKRRRHP